MADACMVGRGRVAEAGLSEVSQLKRLRALRQDEDETPEQPTLMEEAGDMGWPGAICVSPGGVLGAVDGAMDKTAAGGNPAQKRLPKSFLRNKMRDALKARWKTKEGN